MSKLQRSLTDCTRCMIKPAPGPDRVCTAHPARTLLPHEALQGDPSLAPRRTTAPGNPSTRLYQPATIISHHHPNGCALSLGPPHSAPIMRVETCRTGQNLPPPGHTAPGFANPVPPPSASDRALQADGGAVGRPASPTTLSTSSSDTSPDKVPGRNTTHLRASWLAEAPDAHLRPR